MSLSYILNAVFSDSAINPVKILVLFISMTILSVFLDETGFFRFLANATLKRAGGSQKKLFVLLYVIVSVLTVFTSNDIIVLTFTPFICYFASSAKINPLPYLITVFVAANTWSMALIIGNPTNIYLATYGGITFLGYIKNMILPTLFAGLTGFLMLYVLFRNELKVRMERVQTKAGHISNPVLLGIGILHLAIATVMLAVSSYVNVEMWIVALCSVGSLFVCNLIASLFMKRKPVELIKCLKRAPWTLVPFLLGMFILILFLDYYGVSAFLTRIIPKKSIIVGYGLSSFLACNVINNIPMSVLFCSVVDGLPKALQERALFSVITGSNIGAFLTPIGALAGVMWRKILKTQGIEFSVKSFVKYGSLVGIPSIIAALGALCIVF